jgi:hypothetical protein
MRELLGDQRALVHLELVRGELRELGRGRGLVVIAAALGFLLLRGHIDPAGAMRLLRVFPLWRRIGPKWDEAHRESFSTSKVLTAFAYDYGTFHD